MQKLNTRTQLVAFAVLVIFFSVLGLMLHVLNQTRADVNDVLEKDRAKSARTLNDIKEMLAKVDSKLSRSAEIDESMKREKIVKQLQEQIDAFRSSAQALITEVRSKANSTVDQKGTVVKASPKSTLRGPGFPGYAWAHDSDCSVLGDIENNNPHVHNRPTTYKAFLEWKQAQNPGRKLVGLEIGALHNKAPLGVDNIEMHYIDYLPAEELKKMYPEWKDIQVPDIVSDAEALRGIADEYADFYIWSHVIEHTELSLKALNNSLRVVRPNGYVFLMVPNMCRTFDRQRLTTNWEHFVEEFYDESAAARNKKEHYREWTISHLTAAEHNKYVANGHLNVLQPKQSDVDHWYNHFYEKKYSIHYHTWTPTSLLEFIVRAKTDLGFKLDLLYFSLESLNMIVVLQKSI